MQKHRCRATLKNKGQQRKQRMTIQADFIRKSGRTLVRLALVSSFSAAALLIPGDSSAGQDSEQIHAAHAKNAPAKLVQIVRDATRQFINVNGATAAGYQPFLGCVSGPDHGAMGVHYVNGGLVGDGEIDATKPEALIYEPSSEGMKLVGVEFVVIAETWLAHHSSPPVLEDQTFQFVNSPNRYGLPAHFELHVWAWRDNPNGSFVDWNNSVSCENQ
jgi:hypothetical protein